MPLRFAATYILASSAMLLRVVDADITLADFFDVVAAADCYAMPPYAPCHAFYDAARC